MKNINIIRFFGLIILFFSARLDASTRDIVLQGNFQEENIKTEFIYNSSDYGLKITYHLPDGKIYKYDVEKYDECSSMALYMIPQTREIAIDGSCASQGGQIYVNVYKWDSASANWCLRREITGEKAYLNGGAVVPNQEVARVDGCFKPGMTGPYPYQSEQGVKEAIAAELRQFRFVAHDKAAIKHFIASMPSYSVYELSRYIGQNTVQDINDIAFFLSESNRSYEAISLLENIVHAFPQRTVAKLNLADAYWNNGLKDKAINFYKDYQGKMIADGLQGKIPLRVTARVRGAT